MILPRLFEFLRGPAYWRKDRRALMRGGSRGSDDREYLQASCEELAAAMQVTRGYDAVRHPANDGWLVPLLVKDALAYSDERGVPIRRVAEVIGAMADIVMNSSGLVVPASDGLRRDAESFPWFLFCMAAMVEQGRAKTAPGKRAWT